MKLIVLILLASALSLMSCKSDGSDLGAPSAALIDVDWTLTALIMNDQPVEFASSEPAPSLRLESSRGLIQASGFAGVNRYSGTCNLGDEGRISFPPLITTRMAGPPERMQLESVFLTQLQAAGTFVIRDGELTILAEHGRLQFRGE